MAARTPTTMRAWRIYGYGEPDQLKLESEVEVPAIANGTDVLIEVHASSLNPIDASLLRGYGRTILNALRFYYGMSEFPMTLGRDLCGRVEAVGSDVTRFRPGDWVWAGVSPLSTGTLAEYAVVPESSMSLAPASLSPTEATSLAYVALTTHSALVTYGGLTPGSARRGAQVLVLGASGGVGTLAVQLLKAWECQVTATCAADAMTLVKSLGADTVVDYRSETAVQQLTIEPGYDVIFKCSGGGAAEHHLPLLKPWGRCVSINSPLLRNFDQSGLLVGALKNAVTLLFNALYSLCYQGRVQRWAFFRASGEVLQQLRQLVKEKKIRPVIDSEFDFGDVPAAFRHLKAGHSRGKTVIRVKDRSASQ